MSNEITPSAYAGNIFEIVISLLTNAGSFVNDIGRLGIGIINLLISIFGAKIPETISMFNLNISTALFMNVLVFGGALWVIWTKFADMFKTYLKLILAGGCTLLLLSVIGAVI